VLTILYVCSIAFYNFFGLSVAKQLTTVHRTFIDSLRTVVVCMLYFMPPICLVPTSVLDTTRYCRSLLRQRRVVGLGRGVDSLPNLWRRCWSTMEQLVVAATRRVLVVDLGNRRVQCRVPDPRIVLSNQGAARGRQPEVKPVGLDDHLS
jgi:hypothetical protein